MTTPTPNLSVSALDQAVDVILQNNFDADTKICFTTLMKVLDNVIQKPYDPKVRSIRLGNPAFQKRVASRKGGVEFLLACGFEQGASSPPLLSGGNNNHNASQESFLILKDEDESITEESERQIRKEKYTSHIITARRLLLTRAIRDLHMKSEELPPYKPPPPPVAMNQNFTSKGDPSASFNPYQPQRYDGMSAAVGTQLTPDGSYESTTEKQLKTLQQKQQKLEQKLQKELMDRQWVASHPNASGKPAAILMDIDTTTDNTKDGGLIAAQFQKQQAQKKQREEGGFTTKTMRELEKLKKSKVYTHTQLALQFSDGTVVQGKFLPRETIQTVITRLRQDCLVAEASAAIELYVTPPRKTLPPSSTLQTEGLVPAAKIFVKMALPNHRPFIKPELFQALNNSASFPSSQPIVADPKAKDDDDDLASAKSNNNNSNATMSAEEKEEAMMRRMLGGGRRLGGGGNNAASGGAKKSKPTGNKPKWFK